MAKIGRKEALGIGIAVDFRRRNKCNESLQLNVQRLCEDGKSIAGGGWWETNESVVDFGLDGGVRVRVQGWCGDGAVMMQ